MEVPAGVPFPSLVILACNAVAKVINEARYRMVSSVLSQLPVIPAHCWKIIFKTMKGSGFMTLEDKEMLPPQLKNVKAIWKSLYHRDIPAKRDLLKPSQYEASGYSWREIYFSGLLNYWIQENCHAKDPKEFDIPGIPYVRIVSTQGTGWLFLRKNEWSDKLTNLHTISAVNLFIGSYKEFMYFVGIQNSLRHIEILFPSLRPRCIAEVMNYIGKYILLKKEKIKLERLVFRSLKYSDQAFTAIASLILQTFHSLQTLKIEAIDNVTDSQMASFLATVPILTFPQLSHFGITGCLIGQQSMKMLCSVIPKEARACRLSLDFSDTVVTRYGVEYLSKLIESGYMLDCIVLDQNPIHNDGAMLLGNSLLHPSCTLRALRLVNCSIKCIGGSSIMAALQSNQSLEELDLSENTLRDDHTNDFAVLCGKVLLTNQTLRILKLSQTLLYILPPLFVEGLSGNRSLQEIFLCGNRLKAPGIASLQEILKKNQTLRALHVSGNLLSTEDASRLALTLQERKKRIHHSLQYLDIRFNQFNDFEDVVHLKKQFEACVTTLLFQSMKGEFIADGIQEF